MKHRLVLLVGLWFLFPVCLLSSVVTNTITPEKVSFIENKGQVSDQNHKPRPDVLFMGESSDLNFHLRKSGISYQFIKITSDKRRKFLPSDPKMFLKELSKPVQIDVYRLDLNWIGANNRFAVQKEECSESYTNYYLSSCPQGVGFVYSYSGVTYKNIYAGIDVHFYSTEGVLKYDYLVAAGADYRKIEVKVSGAKKIYIDEKKNLVIRTPMGNIYEEAPRVLQNGRSLRAKWVIRGDLISFDIVGVDPGSPFVIDPAVRNWGTYYGGSGTDYSFSCSTAPGGFVYKAGSTDWSGGTTIATAGSYQSQFSGFEDAFLAKFNTAGVRQWATYYGDASFDRAMSCATDSSGNIFLAGQSGGGLALASAGCHQPLHAGGNDEGFVAKFNSSGQRLWGTFYGGSGYDYVYSCASSPGGDVYIAGYTDCSTGTVIATTNGFQPVYGGGAYDAFFVKFDGSGTRLWGTYYGGANVDDAYGCAVDGQGNPYLCGVSTSSGSAIVTSNAHQTTLNGFDDAFLVKFNAAGARLWATFYGGANGDYGRSCVTDASGNVFLAGYTITNANQVIATVTSHQPAFGGGMYDAFLVKFNSGGTRLWGTYYGGLSDDFAYSCDTDPAGNVYLGGTTNTTGNNVIPSTGSHQMNNNGGYDSFISKFDYQGQRIWATYYGGAGWEMAWQCSANSTSHVYLSGSTQSFAGTVIASSNGHKPVGGGATDAYLVQFGDCPPLPPVNVTPASNLTMCAGESTTLSVNGSGNINWYLSATGGTAVGTGSVLTTPPLASGLQTFYADATTCAPSFTRTAITVTVSPTGSVSISNASICAGQIFTLVPSGALSYVYSSGSSTVSPLLTTNYTITGTHTINCFSSAPAIVTISVGLLPTVTVNSGTICSGDNFIMFPNGASSYLFSPIGPVVSPITNSTYSVTGLGSNGCTSSTPAIAFVKVTAIPVLTLTSSQLTVCAGETVTLSVNGAEKHSWNITATGDTVVFKPQSTGVITVFGTNAPSCISSTSLQLVVDACNNVFDETSYSLMKVFPIPMNNELTCISGEPTEIMLFDSMSRLVLFSDRARMIHRLSTESLPSGIYFLVIKSDNGSQSRKILKN